MPPKPKQTYSSSKTRTADIEKKLTSIYQDENGDLPDLRQIRHPQHSFPVRVLTGIFVLALIGGLGMVAQRYVPGRTLNEQSDITLTITAPEKAAIGQRVTYSIAYKPQAEGIQKARLQLTYPKGFEFISANPKPSDEKKGLWEWEALQQKETQTVTVTGKLFGDEGQAQSLRTFFEYQPKNFNSTFQKVASAETVTSLSPLSLSVEGLEKPIQGKTTEYTVVLTNITEEPLKGLLLVAPKGDTQVTWLKDKTAGLPKDATPIETSRGLVLPEVPPSAQWRIVYSVTTPQQALPTATPLLLGWQVLKENAETSFTIAHTEKSVTTERNDLQLQLLVNGATETTLAKPGDTLTFSVFYKNNGTQSIQNLEITAALDAPSADGKSLFDWANLVETSDATVTGKQINPTVRRGNIVWTKKEIPELQLLTPGKEGIINFQLPIKQDPKTLDAFEDFKAQVQLTAVGTIAKKTEQVSLSPLTIFFNSDTAFSSDIKSHDASAYTVTMKIDNSWHGLKNIRAKTKLFGTIEWQGTETTPPGTLSYDAKTGSLQWDIPEMPVEASVLSTDFKFKLTSVNPTQTALTDKILFTATDVITGKQIVLEHVELPLPTSSN
jgi:uncharacterized repeat protein (TIGR01451 family)